MIKETLFLLILLSSNFIYAEVDVIIGKDDRTQITDLKKDRIYSAIGIIRDHDKESVCSGTLITQRHVLTNGHCVVLWSEYPTPLSRTQALTFTPGKLNKDSAPYGTFQITKIKTFAVWTQTGNINYDVAVLELDRPTGILAVKIGSYKNSKVLINKKISVTGYSSQKELGTMWNGDGVVKSITGNGQSLFHTADTLPGTSGSLIRIKFKDEWIGIGVHRGGQEEKSEMLNRGVLINSTVLEAIKRWIK